MRTRKFLKTKKRVIVSQLSRLRRGFGGQATLNSQLNSWGITLIEVMITTAILCAALLPLVSLFMHGTRGTVNIAKANIAMELARELMDEIKGKQWDEWNAKDRRHQEKAVPKDWRSRVGPDDKDDDPEKSKRDFDDIDDYDGWEEDPPQNIEGTRYDGQGTYIDGTKLPDYTEYKRQVKVRYVEGSLNEPDVLEELGKGAAEGSATNGKQVTVIVSWGGKKKENRRVISSCILCNYTRELEVVEE